MYTLSDLPYAYNALEPYIDEQTMRIHHDKHHGAYVKNVNEALVNYQQINTLTIEQLLSDLNNVPEEVRTKVRNNGGGHYNHSLFWQVMSPNPDGALRLPQGDLAVAINGSFESFEKFTELFSTAALSRFGSGWVWLTVDHGALKIEDSPNQDNPLMNAVPARLDSAKRAGRQGKTPILGLDVWEHAYYLKYQNMRADYIKNWWNVVHWSEVEKRFSELK